MRHSNIAITVRLACVRHAANVHPEPGSNSPFDFSLEIDKAFRLALFLLADGLFCFPRCPSTAVFHLTLPLLSCESRLVGATKIRIPP